MPKISRASRSDPNTLAALSASKARPRSYCDTITSMPGELTTPTTRNSTGSVLNIPMSPSLVDRRRTNGSPISKPLVS